MTGVTSRHGALRHNEDIAGRRPHGPAVRCAANHRRPTRWDRRRLTCQLTPGPAPLRRVAAKAGYMSGFADRAMPIIHFERCTLCGDCVPACPQAALSLGTDRLILDPARCAYCGDCEDVCPTGAIDLPFEIIVRPRPANPREGASLCDDRL